MSYLPPSGHSKKEIKMDLDLSTYATKSDLKNATSVDTSQFAKNLKSRVDELDTDKLKKVPSSLKSLKNKIAKLDVDNLTPVPVDLKKLSDVVDNDVVKNIIYDQLIKNVNTINTS